MRFTTVLCRYRLPQIFAAAVVTNDDVKLPRSLPELYGVYEDYLKDRKYDALTPQQQIIWKYCKQAMISGRPLGSVVILMAGYSGSGKSSTINSLFDDPNICETSSSESATKDVALVRKLLKVTDESPPIVASLGFIDTPGTTDTNSRREVQNYAKMKSFIQTMAELERRDAEDVPSPLTSQVRKDVYPNLVILVVSATDNRIDGPDSNFSKTVRLLKQMGNNLVDKKHPNLIIVLTSAMLCSDKRGNNKKLSEKINLVRKVVKKELGVFDVDVIPVENQPDNWGLVKEGDFYKLPNGELSHSNLLEAMSARFDKNNDLLGKLLVSWYLIPWCPEKSQKPEVIKDSRKLSEASIHSAADLLKKQNILVPLEFCKRKLDLQLLGHGYCPITEAIKPGSLIQDEDVTEWFSVVKYGKDDEYIIQACIQSQKKSDGFQFTPLTFLDKTEYEKDRKAKYDIDESFKVLESKSRGKWITNAEMVSVRGSNDHIIDELKIPDPSSSIVNQAFLHQLKKLPDEFKNQTKFKFREFFMRWGTHFVCQVQIGGSVQMSLVLDAGNSFSNKNLRKILASCDFVNDRVASGGTWGQRLESLRREGDFAVLEGKSEIIGGTSTEIENPDNLEKRGLLNWRTSLNEKPAELPHTIKLFPYWQLLPESQQESLRQATVAYLRGEDRDFSPLRNPNTSKAQLGKSGVDEAVAVKTSSHCFPEGTKVTLAARNGPSQSVRIELLEHGQNDRHLETFSMNFYDTFFGDTLQLGSQNKASFCTYLHKNDSVSVVYLVLHFHNGRKLHISDAHLLFEYIGEGKLRAKQAKNFKIGDMAVFVESSTGTSQAQPVRLEMISKEVRKGAYSPLTTSGTFVADGFLVTSYAHVESFVVAETAVAPLKLWYWLQNYTESILLFFGKESESGEGKLVKLLHPGDHLLHEGIHPYARFLMTVREIYNWIWLKVKFV